MPFDANGDWIPDDNSPEDYSGEAAPAAAPAAAPEPGPPVVATQTAEPPLARPPGAYQGTAVDRGGITPIIQHGEGGAVEYNGQAYYTPEAAASARALDIRRNQTPEEQQQLAQQAQQQQPEQPPSSIHMQEQIDRTTLSRNEQLDLTTTQNGIARLQRDARVGLIPPQQAEQMMQQLQQRVQPLMVRQSQLHGMMMAQQYQRNEEQAQQTARLQTQAQQWRAAHAEGTNITLRGPDGQPIAYVVPGQNGHDSIVQAPREPRPAAPARPAAGGGGTNDHFDQAYTAATREYNRRLNAPEISDAERERLSTPEGRQQAIENEVRSRIQAHQNLAGENYTARTRQPGGPVPFDPAAPGDPTPTPRRAVELGFRGAIQRAMDNGQREREAQLRSVAGAFTDVNGDTGRLSPDHQRTLQEVGYYHKEFTPEIDRQLSAATAPRRVDVGGNGEQRVHQVIPPSPAVVQAASHVRTLLAQFGSREDMPPASRRLFDEERGRLGLTVWPPRANSAASDRPPIPANAPPAREFDPNGRYTARLPAGVSVQDIQ